VGVSVRTLRRWNASGLLAARRRPNGRPFYTVVEMRIALDETNDKMNEA
jgi:DNA-binding transcriptional MerR regulator